MADMVFLTRLKPEPMGMYDISRAYDVNSLVMSTDGAAAYLSVKDVPAGTMLTNTEYWKLHTDLSPVKQRAEEATLKALAARDEMMQIARNLTDPVEAEGNPVQMQDLVGGLPFGSVTTVLEPKQAGSGDPAPDNVRPLSSWAGAKLTRIGRNALPNAAKTQTISGVTFTPNADGSITANGTATGTVFYTISDAAPIAPGEYVLRGAPDGGGYATFSIRAIVNGSNIYDDYGDGQSFTVDAGGMVQGYIVIRSGYTATDLRLYPGMYSLSDPQTEYTPYQKEEFSVDFGQTVYSGRLDWQSGALTVDSAFVTVDGTENWISSPNVTDRFLLDVGNGQANVPVVCSHAKGDTPEMKPNTAYMNTTGDFAWNFSALGETTLDEFKAYLAAQKAAGAPVQIAYPLATPTIIQLTPQEIKQLQGANTLYGDGSVAVVGLQNPHPAMKARLEALERAILNA